MNRAGEYGAGLCALEPKTDWQAEWIWLPTTMAYPRRNSYAFFRRTWDNAESGTMALDITADNRYELYLDGRLVGRGPARSNTAYTSFDRYTFTLGGGKHVLATLVHHIGETCAVAQKAKPGLLAQAAVSLPHACLQIGTGPQWRTWPGRAWAQDLPHLMSHFGFYEVRDFREIPSGWADVDFDDSSWPTAEVTSKPGEAPWIRLIPRDIPLLATREIPIRRVVSRGCYREPTAMSETPRQTVAEMMCRRIRVPSESSSCDWPLQIHGADQSGRWLVLDAGRVMAGYVQLDFQNAEDGQTVDVGYDECLQSDGTLDPLRTYVHAADRMVLREGQSRAVFFNRRGFRYLLLDIAGSKRPLGLSAVCLHEETYPVVERGDFSCSDRFLNEIWKAGAETVRLCMEDAYTDCCTRERVQWLFDIAIESLVGFYAFGDLALWRRALYMFAQAPADGGMVRGFVPTDRTEVVLQTFSLFYVVLLADYVLYSGDRETARNLFSTAMKQLEAMESFAGKDGLLNDSWKGWNFVDWALIEDKGTLATVNAIYILAHKKAVYLADYLGEGESLRLKEKTRRLSLTFLRAFWVEQEGLFSDSVLGGVVGPVRSQQANLLAVLAGVVKRDRGRDILKHILNPDALLPRSPGEAKLNPKNRPQTGGIVQIGTPALGHLLCQALFEHGLAKEAIDYIRREWPSVMTAGTLREHFVVDKNTSYCHGWSAGPTVSLSAYVLGARPAKPGWGEIVVSPQLGDLEWARGTVPTPHGPVSISCRKNGQKMECHVDAPDGVRVVRA